MFFNKHNGKIVKVNLTKAEQTALNREIYERIMESDKLYRDEIDAIPLWTLHEKYGFGEKRLRAFYEEMRNAHEALVKHYEMPEDDGWLCVEKLKQIGIDVHKWNEEADVENECK